MTPLKISNFDLKESYEGFVPSTAKKLAELIQQSYLQFDIAQLKQLFNEGKSISEFPTATGVNDWNTTEDYKLIAKLGTNQTPFGFVAKDRESNNIYIVFRGTKKIAEWFKDANIQLVSYADHMIVDDTVDIKKWQILENKIKFASDDICANIPNAHGFGCVTAGFRGIYVSLRWKKFTWRESRRQLYLGKKYNSG